MGEAGVAKELFAPGNDAGEVDDRFGGVIGNLTLEGVFEDFMLLGQPDKDAPSFIKGNAASQKAWLLWCRTVRLITSGRSGISNGSGTFSHA